jgi:excisionase family DNA binding protein
MSRRKQPTPTAQEEPLLLTVSQVMQRLQLGRNTVYDLINRKELRSIKVGSARRVPAKSLEQYIAKCEDAQRGA